VGSTRLAWIDPKERSWSPVEESPNRAARERHLLSASELATGFQSVGYRWRLCALQESRLEWVHGVRC
jgi:hypothetical protein